MENTKFFSLVNEALSKECDRICDFTDALDKNPNEKKVQITEYKCAKYRYAAISTIHAAIYNINRCRGLHNMSATHYLLLPFDELFKQHEDYVALYDGAADGEKPDYSLYYGMLAFADEEMKKLESKFPSASDWEKVELEERLGGLEFAKDCLDEAWQKRKE
ncbi:MAG: hypothetical protein IJW00_09335 [Clostridia bacterium]|nr:hypothetical protein [Clostridia bacterium]